MGRGRTKANGGGKIKAKGGGRTKAKGGEIINTNRGRRLIIKYDN